MFSAFYKGVGELSNPAARKVVWFGLFAAIITFAVLVGGILLLLWQTALFQMMWLDWVVDFLGGGFAVVVAWLLFPGVMSAVIGLFLEDVAKAVEDRHYPDLPPAREIPISEAIVGALKFLASMVVLNLFLLVFLFIAPLFPFVFYGVNGYLLSREYFELVAARRIPPKDARRLRKRHQGMVFASGVLTAFLLTVPVVNLLAPIVATAAMVHLFEGWRRET